MNIFVVDEDPKVAARSLCDKHVVKMILESAQLMSTAHRVLNATAPYIDSLYRASHVNHPSSIWARSGLDNYNWLYDHFQEMCLEYTRRYGKVHATDAKMSKLLKQAPENIPKGMTPFAQAMPVEYKNPEDAVQAYRLYYIKDKAKIATWKIKEHQPEWFNLD